MRRSTLTLATIAMTLSLVGTPRSARPTGLACQGSVEPVGPSPATTMQFTALSGNGSSSCYFTWFFGDGSQSSEQNPQHTYAIGVYNAVLTVADPVSQETCSDTVLVVAGLVRETQSCRAFASTSWGPAPLSVTFNALASSACGPGPYTWTWRFGDGQSGAAQSVQHEYSEPGTYWAAVTQHTSTGSCDCSPVLQVTALKSAVTDVGQPTRDGGLRLEPVRPNPFRLMTTIGFELPRPGRARLTILDVHGRSVAELVNGFLPAGPALSIWQGRAASGRIAPAGLYIVRLEHEGVVTSTRLVRMR